MLNPGSPLARLLLAPVRPGRVAWIGVRSARRAPLVPLASVRLDPRDGLAGDHAGNRARQVTLVQREHLDAIASHLGLARLEPERLRRNVVVSGINLLALKGCRLRVGTATLEVTGECHPCSRMEELLGSGGYNAVRGHGGVIARIVAAGEVRLGDAVERRDDVAAATADWT